MEIGTLHPVAYAQPPARHNDHAVTDARRDWAQPTSGPRTADPGVEQLTQEERKQKALKIQRAAMAPASPSAQDRAVAASAHNEALAQHFANTVTPREPHGALISSVA